MPTVVYLARHAEPYNPQRILYGRLPGFPLSPKGRQDAHALGQRLRDEAPQHLYSSPLLRARQTARAIAAELKEPLPVHIISAVLEVKTAWQGHRLDEVPGGFNYYDDPVSPDDDTIEGLFARMDHALRSLVRRHPENRLVCVSHGDPIAALRIGYRGRPFTLQALRSDDYPLMTSVTVLSYPAPDARPRMEYWPPVAG